jgi:hypothetical protein
VTTTRELLARAYFYTKLGWSNYIAWWLGAVAYLTIIYQLILVRVFPSTVLAYFLIFLTIIVLSFVLGFTMTKKKVYGVEAQINTEANPYINRIIGKKERVNYELSLKALELAIASSRANVQFLKNQAIDTAEMENKIAEYMKYRQIIVEMLQDAA